jgi:glutathione peroxidase
MIASVRPYLVALYASLCLASAPAAAQSSMSRVSAHAFSFATLDGGTLRLAAHAGKPILIVNTASLCGYTPQYSGLQQLWTRFGPRGLLIVGVPSNDFGSQEPGGASDVAHTAHGQHGVTFALAAKAEVKGPNAHPFYRWATLERPLDTPRWNFHKYLIGRDGRIVAAFASAVEPTDPRLVAAIEKELVH